MSAEMEEGFRMEMAELIRQEKELEAKLGVIEQKLTAPEAKLEKAKQIVLKAKAALEQCLEEVRPLRSERELVAGELGLVVEKKSKLRQEAAFARGQTMRPGTTALVEQMNELAGGDMAESQMKKEVKAAGAAQALEELKKRMGQ